ncbi:DUF3806 domain-containing protein [Marinimicrobium sp. ABcell2]|uniref:DUF3806 domain-containing protein n=1 Tax=Marinimicrobium sp. ABcell2 TaxID=3069751 RepID=UPI0027B2696E|nr:DUF3806 domain-containing protein [Marinimicrobium sp. ABcell2]MDQ2075501.1 DUF3806 domain-containing protein [Marinimicrobium sp. ABcell2]
MIRRLSLSLCLLLGSIGMSISAHADARIEELSWMDRNHMHQQVESIETLVQMRLGTRLRGDASDLTTLQTIVDRGMIPRDDKLRLQALGAVLGNVMEAEVAQLKWKIYEDDKGRSRALCVEGTKECLFPVTMLSRRIEVGLKPDVQKVYNDAMKLMEPFLPKMPYTGTSYR